MALWNYCSFCGKRIEMSEKCYGLPNGASVCINCCVVENGDARWEWFDEETGTPFTGYERAWGWRCSSCKEELPDDYDDPDIIPSFRFCYNCGSEMSIK